MNRSRITSAVATAALVGGLAATQFAAAGSAFAYDSGADLNTVLGGGFLYDTSTGKVQNGGLDIDFGNHGPEAAKATVTVTAVKNIHFTAKPKLDKGTVTSWSEKKIVVQVNLGPNDAIVSMHAPATVANKKQTLKSDIKGDKADPDTSNNSKTMNYSVDAPDWNGGGKPTDKPKPPKPTEKPTSKPTEKPTEKPSEKPTSKPSDDSNDPAPAGGSDKGGSGGGGDLAETGGNSNTPMLIGGAGALVVVGGAAVFMAQRRKAAKN